jgi:hypothetical protein
MLMPTNVRLASSEGGLSEAFIHWSMITIMTRHLTHGKSQATTT